MSGKFLVTEEALAGSERHFMEPKLAVIKSTTGNSDLTC